jgi:hypothetical protein
MELLIICNRAQTAADVVPADDVHSVPPGVRARVVAPGESYLGIPYATWREHVGRSVNLEELGGWTPARKFEPEPEPAPVAMSAVLDAAFQLVRRGSFPLVALAAALHLPSFLASIMGQDLIDGPRDLLWFTPPGLASYGLSQAVLIVALSHAYHGARPDLRHAVAQTLRRGVAVAGATLLAGLLMLLGLIFFLVPGLVLFCRYFAVPAVVVLEGQGPWRALGRSGSLTRGNGWSIFATMATLQLLSTLVTYGLERLAAGGAWASAVTAAGFAASAFTFLLTAAVTTAFYYALRVSREAYDLQLLTDALPAPA